MATRLNFTLRQGETFSKVVRWEGLPLIYKVITGITKAAPAVVTAVGHGLPDGWRAAITNAGGMRQINATVGRVRARDYHRITVLSADTVELNGVDAAGYTAYTSGGALQYMTPMSLGGFTARMMIRPSAASATTLHELTTENGGITLDNAAKTISLLISATDTAAATWTNGVYDLEMESTGGLVTRIMYGNARLVREVTR